MPDVVTSMVEYIRDLPHLVKLAVLILSVSIEYVFPIYPGDTIVVLAGFLNAHGAMSIFDISVAIVGGSIIGALGAYGLGRFIANNRHKYKWINRLTSSENFIKFNQWYQKWGSAFLLLNRFFSGVRALFFIAAGTARLPLARVLILGCCSAILFNACLIALGFWLGYNAELILKYLYRYNLVLYLLLAIIGCAALFYYLVGRNKK